MRGWENVSACDLLATEAELAASWRPTPMIDTPERRRAEAVGIEGRFMPWNPEPAAWPEKEQTCYI
jgi:hypothetical protein